jgi:hypothetical protein
MLPHVKDKPFTRLCENPLYALWLNENCHPKYLAIADSTHFVQ